MPRAAYGANVVPIFNNVVFPSGAPNASEAGLAIQQVLLWYEQIGTSPPGTLHIFDSNDLLKPAWQHRVSAAEAWIAQQLGVPVGRLPALLNQFMRARGGQAHNQRGAAYRCLVAETIERWGAVGLDVHEEEPASNWFAVAALGQAGRALVSVRGHTLEEWAPLTVRFLIGRFSGRARFRAQLAQVGHLVGVPEGGLEPETPGEPKALPAELARLEFLEGELASYGGTPFGVIVDRAAKTMTAVLRCQDESFALLGAQEREQRLAEYGGVLASLARDGSAVRRIAWTERTLPANRDQLAQYVVDHKREDLSLDEPTDELVSYFQLLRSGPDVAEDHVLLFSVQIDLYRPTARQAIKRRGGGDLGGMAVLADELRQVIGLLDSAGIAVTGALTRRGVAAAVRNAYDPWGRQQRERVSPDGLAAMSAGPMARDERWSHIETDGALHSTLWIAEWPRIDVRATFLQPLLTSSHATRTVTMVMELVGPSKAIRLAERAVTENSTNESMRARIGQRTTKRVEQKELATQRREEELATGHAEVRFAGFITVSTPSIPGGLDELESTVARVELEAKRALLRVERMWGQQAEAFTYGALPLCRGLR